MHDQIRMGYLGLSDNEIRVLRSIFSLSPQLNESYVLTGSTGLEKADLILVNVDDPVAVTQWNKITQINSLVTPMTLSADGKTIDGVVPLKRPIRLQHLIDALDDVINERSTFDVPASDSGGGIELQALIVDDSYPVRKYMEQKLSDLINFPVHLGFAASGEEAMTKLSKKSYDLIFLDVVMEGVDGYKVCKAIKARHEAYVVMLTSKKSPFDKVRGTMSGCDAYITKPPPDARLSEEVQKCVKRLAKTQNKYVGADRAVGL